MVVSSAAAAVASAVVSVVVLAVVSAVVSVVVSVVVSAVVSVVASVISVAGSNVVVSVAGATVAVVSVGSAVVSKTDSGSGAEQAAKERRVTNTSMDDMILLAFMQTRLSCKIFCGQSGIL